ncbi:MAG: helix-turn-helix transcriptional regulator [Ruminococcaceae bacterium]|nr:helix-turn-helix transcriptional regulator [Oscillospiraceae bacterium]
MSIGKKLKKFRESHGLTQEQFAYKAGVKRTTYISYENDRTIPDFLVISRIAKEFGVDINEFCDEEIEPKFAVLNAPEVIYNAGANNNKKTLTSEERLLLAYFRTLGDGERKEFFEKIKNDFLDRRCGTNEE